MDIILILIGLVIVGYILVKLVFPLLGKVLKYLLAALIPALIIIGVGLVIFIGAAAFSGMVETPLEDGDAPLMEQHEGIKNAHDKIEGKIDSMEGGFIDRWIKKKQKEYNEKH